MISLPETIEYGAAVDVVKQRCGTLSDFIDQHFPEQVDVVLTEKFTNKFYHMSLQCVLDNGFSEFAQKAFPRVKDFNSLKAIRKWWSRLIIWFWHILDNRERAIFSHAEFIWK